MLKLCVDDAGFYYIEVEKIKLKEINTEKVYYSYCPNCKKLIDDRAKRCKKCENKRRYKARN